jgi:hypothetical protein
MMKRILQGFVVMFSLALLTADASATVYNETIPAGLGTLSYTATVTALTCQVFVAHQLRTLTYYDVAYGSFSYTASGVTTPLTGSVDSVDDPSYIPGQPCPASSFPSVSLTGGGVAIAFTPSGETGGAAVYGGFINPKYLIVGVMYAPPGAKSTVTYANNNVVGNSNSITESFSGTVTDTVSLAYSLGIPGFSTKQTDTESNSYTQSQDTTTSIAISQTTSASSGLNGYSDPANGLNHDYDYIFVWLNPIVTFVVSEVSGKTQVTWTGYGYDLNDTADYPDMDVIGVELGCLNGDFYQQYVAGTNTNWVTCEDIFNNNFDRNWALNNTDGSSPALTPTLANSSAPYNFCQQANTDLYKVCQADPFANPGYTVQFASGATTTKDGRFTACTNSLCNTTIEYEPNVNKTYSQGYSTTISGSQNDKYSYTSSYSIESQFTEGGGKDGFSETISETFSQTNSFTTSEQFSKATNNSNGETSSFSIVGPAEGYSGPTQFVVYQDNLYGTFMFYAGN